LIKSYGPGISYTKKVRLKIVTLTLVLFVTSCDARLLTILSTGETPPYARPTLAICRGGDEEEAVYVIVQRNLKNDPKSSSHLAKGTRHKERLSEV
jgi:hypothetical protein